MLGLQKQISLRALNSFGFDSVAERYTEITQKAQIPALIDYCQEHALPCLLLGGGSNLVLSAHVPGVVARIRLQGIEVISRSQQTVRVRVAAGEPWHETVSWLLDQGFYGLENLALIPGTVGASPVQNIGAYGVELKDRVTAVNVYDTLQRQFTQLSPSECQFSYRDSLFKSVEPGRYIITSVEFELFLTPDHLVLNYQALQETCTTLAGSLAITPRHLFDAVCQLRRSKLPDPATLGNAGSFFKNPHVNEVKFQALKQTFSSLVAYPEGAGYKLAAGWLIESCGWKGKQFGQVGVYARQSLVLVNYGGGDRSQIEALALQIQDAVYSIFGVWLEPEPRYYP
ncbi:UDP-N-acetylmuramate dehydrogenase [Nitrincola iocasae]|uniref:UDP-N-acetylenolpyruvoylglucosamine reductase n=1 Tax=Nitrincola iocasae TaxID=2614693 RepID=A0A5J6LDA8_9GAMM|nr:UDP-N-acetylmuramate dehydrogenase [Nitrincola iocasae]QEW06517.1 UDP-N-acetylmuramate dehydrogenase [Nitrincola iocasae]